MVRVQVMKTQIMMPRTTMKRTDQKRKQVVAWVGMKKRTKMRMRVMVKMMTAIIT
jgi:hypothetical protein